MKNISTQLNFFLGLAKAQAVLTRRFDTKLGGLSLSEFLILYTLSLSEDETMRRVDLAEKIGLTASGVTRLLVPMEKIGLVKREMTEHDARVRNVTLAPGGKRKLEEGLERAELFAEELIPDSKAKKLSELTQVVSELV